VRRSTDRIITTHVGALPGPTEAWTDDLSEAQLQPIVDDVVAKQRAAGVDVLNEGEWAKGGSFGDYFVARLSGFEPGERPTIGAALGQRSDWIEFDDFYKQALEGGTLFEQTRSTAVHTINTRQAANVCRGPVRYTGQAALERELRLLRSALGTSSPGDAFLTTTSPACIEWGRVNEYYRDQEEFVFAIGEAMKTEYDAIAAAGFIVHVDDPWLAALWDGWGERVGLDAYKQHWMMRIEALNHALGDVPEEQIRFHVCWGSWHGPHAYDIPLADIVDLMLAIKSQAYLFEAANVRHEHEYALWETVRLPAGKILAPGVVTHSTALIEHPVLVAQRIERFARIIGPENVIASTDCGLGLRCHPQIAWAKLKTLAEGAALASRNLGLGRA
jgi:5-methyltetrahydropteroyltriglutamate--homocysteine methyltransferase